MRNILDYLHLDTDVGYYPDVVRYREIEIMDNSIKIGLTFIGGGAAGIKQGGGGGAKGGGGGGGGIGLASTFSRTSSSTILMVALASSGKLPEATNCSNLFLSDFSLFICRDRVSRLSCNSEILCFVSMCIDVSFSSRSFTLAKLASMSSWKEGGIADEKKSGVNEHLDLDKTTSDNYFLLRSQIQLLFLLGQSRRHVRVFSLQLLGLLPSCDEFFFLSEQVDDLLHVDLDRRHIGIPRHTCVVTFRLKNDLLHDPVEQQPVLRMRAIID